MVSLRKGILIRDNHKCRWCESTEKLQVHHLNHDKSSIDDVVTLCHNCHYRIHQIEKTLFDGELSYIYCGNCRDAKGEFVGQFIAKKILSNKKTVWTCPNCGRGFISDKEFNILDEWKSNPFHKVMMDTYYTGVVEQWTKPL